MSPSPYRVTATSCEVQCKKCSEALQNTAMYCNALYVVQWTWIITVHYEQYSAVQKRIQHIASLQVIHLDSGQYHKWRSEQRMVIRGNNWSLSVYFSVHCSGALNLAVHCISQCSAMKHNSAVFPFDRISSLWAGGQATHTFLFSTSNSYFRRTQVKSSQLFFNFTWTLVYMLFLFSKDTMIFDEVFSD